MTKRNYGVVMKHNGGKVTLLDHKLDYDDARLRAQSYKKHDDYEISIGYKPTNASYHVVKTRTFKRRFK